MTLKTQLALLVFVAGVVAPATAMDFKNSGTFKGAGIAGTYIATILEQKESERKEQEAQVEEQAITQILVSIKRPKGGANRQKPTRKKIMTLADELQLDEEVETKSVETKAPAKMNGGKSYGVDLDTLDAVKLKKMAAKSAPSRPVSQAPVALQDAGPAEISKQLEDYTLLDAANQKLELAYALTAYAKKPSENVKVLIFEYAKISKQLQVTPPLAEALTKIFEAQDEASRQGVLENIKTNILKVM